MAKRVQAKTQGEAEAFHFDGKDALILVALLLVAAIALWPILNAPRYDAPGLPDSDARTQWYPWRAYAADSIRHGVLPLWNPYILCGLPFMANFQSALFYPPNLLFLFEPMGVAARASILFHLWLSMIFAYLLARMCGCGRIGCAVGAMSFGFCAEQLLRVPAGHWGVSCAIPWLALILLCTEWTMRRPNRLALVLGAAAVALQILSGMPQYVFITAVAAAFYALIRGLAMKGVGWKGRGKRWGVSAGMWALGAAVAGIQLVPGMESAAHGARSLPAAPQWAEVFSLGPECLLTMVAPGLFGGGSNGFYWGRFYFWEMNAYVGIAAFALALYALIAGRRSAREPGAAQPKEESGRLAFVFAATAAAMLILALGRHTPLMEILERGPVSGMFRGPAKFLLPFSLSFSMLAALGAERLVWSPPKMSRLILPAAFLGVIALGIALSAPMSVSGWQSAIVNTREILYAPGGKGTGAEALGAVRDGCRSLVLLAALVGCIAFFRRKRAVAGMLVVFLVAADGVLFSREFVSAGTNFRADGGSAWPEGAGRFLRSLGGGERTLTAGLAELDDGMLERAPTVKGIEPNPPARFNELFLAAQGRPPNMAPSVYQLDPQQGRLLVWTLAVGHVLAPEAATPPSAKARALWRGGGWNIFDLPSPTPRALVVYQHLEAVSPTDALKAAIFNDPRKTVILEGSADSAPPGASETGAEHGDAADAAQEAATEASIVRDDPNRVAIYAELHDFGWLVLLDNDFPGWKAEADGKPAKILRADFAFRAVALSPGRHKVVFLYRPESLYWGFGLSVIGLLAAAGIALSTLKKSGTAANSRAISE